MPDMTPELRQAIAQLIQTADAVEPAVAAEKQRSKLLKWTGAILQSNYFLSASVFGLVVINAVSLYFSLNPVREYFAVDNGRLLPIVALSAPYRTSPQVIQFVSSTLNEALALDFLNWRADQERVRDRFSKKEVAAEIRTRPISGTVGA